MENIGSLAAIQLESERLVLDPLAPEHADELTAVLDDLSLHRFIGGQPPGVEELRARFRRQALGRSVDGTERWLNRTVRERSSGRAVGTIQATIQSGEAGPLAALAWVIGSSYQGRGIAKEAAGLMVCGCVSRGSDHCAPTSIPTTRP